MWNLRGQVLVHDQHICVVLDEKGSKGLRGRWLPPALLVAIEIRTTKNDLTMRIVVCHDVHHSMEGPFLLQELVEIGKESKSTANPSLLLIVQRLQRQSRSLQEDIDVGLCNGHLIPHGLLVVGCASNLERWCFPEIGQVQVESRAKVLHDAFFLQFEVFDTTQTCPVSLSHTPEHVHFDVLAILLVLFLALLRCILCLAFLRFLHQELIGGRVLLLLCVEVIKVVALLLANQMKTFPNGRSNK